MHVSVPSHIRFTYTCNFPLLRKGDHLQESPPNKLEHSDAKHSTGSVREPVLLLDIDIDIIDGTFDIIT